MNEDNDQEIKSPALVSAPALPTQEDPPTQPSASNPPSDSTNPIAETTEPTDQKATESETPIDSSSQPLPKATLGDGGSSKKGKYIIGLILLVLIAGLGYAGWKVSTQKQVTAVKTQQVKKSVAIINVGVIDGSLNSFYPSADDTSATSYQVNNQVYEGLVQFQNVSKVVPSLATSWKNPDDSTWIFNLKSGVKFHDGKTMTAADVKASLEKYQDSAFGGVFTFDAKEITALADNKIKIVTTAPDPLLLHKLAYLMIVDPTAKEGDAAGGTGPYTVKTGTTPSANALDLVAFDQYHGGKPLTKEVKWALYSSEDDLAGDVVKGKVDYTTSIDTEKNIELVSSKTKLTTVSDTGIGVTSLGINVNKKGSPLQNLKFRQAIAAALDKKQIITDSNLKAEPAEQAVTKDVPGYDSSIVLAKPNLDTAKKLLTEAGYPNGASFTISYSKDTAQDQVDSISKQLKQINVTVKQDPYTNFDDLVEKAFTTGTDSYFLSYTTDLLDSSDVLSSLFQNINYTSAPLDALLDQASKTIDPAKRLTDLQSASKLVIDDVGEVPIYSLTFNTTYNPNLMISRDTYNTTYFWHVYNKN